MILKTDQHKNNFDFIRVFAAGLVLFSHQFALLGATEPGFFPGISFGSLGVCIFFSISGFLVCQSWLNDPHPLRFIARRFLRIWPALIVVTVLSALLLGPLISTRTPKEYFNSRETWDYFKNLLLIIKYQLPGVFDANPFPQAVNGSLWTIPVEVKWYWLVLGAGVSGLLKFRYLMLCLLFCLAAFVLVAHQVTGGAAHNYFVEYGLFFLSGACLHLFRDVWSKQLIGLIVCICGAAGAAFALGYPIIGLWLIVPYAVVRFGLASTVILRRFGRFGDCSYGLYIYAFPVQQLVVWSTNASLSVTASLVLSASGTAILAFLSWHLIEQPAMRFRPGQRGKGNRTTKHERLLTPGSVETPHLSFAMNVLAFNPQKNKLQYSKRRRQAK